MAGVRVGGWLDRHVVTGVRVRLLACRRAVGGMWIRLRLYRPRRHRMACMRVWLLLSLAHIMTGVRVRDWRRCGRAMPHGGVFGWAVRISGCWLRLSRRCGMAGVRIG